MNVNQILNIKGSRIYSIPPSITVYEALKMMGINNIGAVLVVESEKLAGILSERDYARKIILKNKKSKETLVSEIMESDLITVAPTDKVEYCMELMSINRIRHLPVLEGEKLVGLISMGDVVKAIIEIQKNTIDHLDSYISQ